MLNKLLNISNEIPGPIMNYVNDHNIGRVDYVCWLEKFEDEILMRVFAYKKKKNSILQVLEVERRVTNNNTFIARNLYFHYLCGYQTDFESIEDWEVFDNPKKDSWKVGYKILNLDLLKDTKYKYCGYNNQLYFTDYISLYNENPEIEFFAKNEILISKALINLAKKDKQFCKFLLKNQNMMHYGARAIIHAYKNNLTVYDAVKILELKRLIPQLKNVKTINYFKLLDYLKTNKIDNYLYNDYLEAIKELKLDLNDTKNLYPNNFMEMHDLRINQMETKKDSELQSKFKIVADKYAVLNFNGEYAVLIAKNPKELLKEGKTLNHCVGRMNYDRKMIEEKSLIMFIRKTDNLSTPFVTMEFEPKTKKILQIYAKNNSKPLDSVQNFINNIWLPYAKKQCRRVYGK